METTDIKCVSQQVCWSIISGDCHERLIDDRQKVLEQVDLFFGEFVEVQEGTPRPSSHCTKKNVLDALVTQW